MTSSLLELLIAANIQKVLFPADPNAGVALQLVLKRRIINELLTTYLPTILILVIVYATNFFKPFFFEAVVTVNLTSLLVLTTLFISVSGKLPPTAYVKMIDIWLIFSQLVPFTEVLLHTFMDCMREEQDREINHHGRSVNVGLDEDTEQSKKVFVVPANSLLIEKTQPKTKTSN